MVTRFVQRLLTSSNVSALGSKSVVAKYFVCAPEDIELLNIGTSCPASNWTKYGTNASYFASEGYMSAFHVFNGSAIRAGGESNCANLGNISTRMDCEYCFYLPSTGSNSINTAIRTNTIPSASNAVTRWAIGGFDLMVSGSYSTPDALKNAIDLRYSSVPDPFNGSIVVSWVPVYNSARARTSLGYRLKNNVLEVVFGIFTGGSQNAPNYSDGPSIFEMHKIMKALGCSNAISLDGGGSSQALWRCFAYSLVSEIIILIHIES